MRSIALRLCPLILSLAACSSGSTVLDGGPDGGDDAGPSPVTDGGALGSACLTLEQCAGNPICASVSSACPTAVLCANQLCASAGGPPTNETVTIGFSPAVTRLPSYLQVVLLAPELVKGGTLDCGAALSGIDAGTLRPNDPLLVNPLVVTYAQEIHPTSTADTPQFTLQASASGTGRVLILQGYLNTAQSDGGDARLLEGCATFDNTTDAGMVSVTLAP